MSIFPPTLKKNTEESDIDLHVNKAYLLLYGPYKFRPTICKRGAVHSLLGTRGDNLSVSLEPASSLQHPFGLDPFLEESIGLCQATQSPYTTSEEAASDDCRQQRAAEILLCLRHQA